MTEFGENLFIIIVIVVITLIIQFYVIKTAIIAALKDFYSGRKSGQTNETRNDVG